jgi:hypothetical protein
MQYERTRHPATWVSPIAPPTSPNASRFVLVKPVGLENTIVAVTCVFWQ